MKKNISGLQFPSLFSLKAMGRNEAEFEAFVVAIVQGHTPGETELSISSRFSQNGAYVSITVRFMAQSREQLDAIYRELSRDERVLMVL